MDLVADLRDRIHAALTRTVARTTLPDGLDLRRFTLEPDRRAFGGGLVVNAALVHGASHPSGPRGLAQALARDLGEDAAIASATAVGPGFVELSLHPGAFSPALRATLVGCDTFAQGRPGRPVSVRVEAPDAGAPPVRLQRARAAVVAHAVAKLLAFSGHPTAFTCAAETDAEAEGLRALGIDPLAASRSDERVAPAAPHDPALVRVRTTSGRGLEGGCGVAVGPCRIVARDMACDDLHGALARVDAGALRLALLCGRADLALDVDLEAVADRSHAAPLFHLGYAYARGCGVRRAAAVAMPDLDLSPAALAGSDIALLADVGEVALLRRIAWFPHVVATAAATREPHRLAAWLRDLADAVHRQWNRSKDQPQLRFVNEEQRGLTRARLGLVTASTIVLESGLGILGVTVRDEMH